MENAFCQIKHSPGQSHRILTLRDLLCLHSCCLLECHEVPEQGGHLLCGLISCHKNQYLCHLGLGKNFPHENLPECSQTSALYPFPFLSYSFIPWNKTESLTVGRERSTPNGICHISNHGKGYACMHTCLFGSYI